MPSSALAAAEKPDANGGQHSTTRAGTPVAVANASASVDAPTPPAQPTTATTRSLGAGVQRVAALREVGADRGPWAKSPASIARHASRSSATLCAVTTGHHPEVADPAGRTATS